MSEVLDGWYADPYGRHEERWISAGRPTDLVRDGGVEDREENAEDLLQVPAVPTRVESSREVDSLSAEDPPVWLASHSGWRKWSRWSIHAPLRTVYQEGAKKRRALVSHLLDPGEEVLSDGPAYRMGPPEVDESDKLSGHLLVTGKQFIYVPEDESLEALPYVQLKAVTYEKQKSGWVAIALLTLTQENWVVVVLPRTVRAARRALKKENPVALR